MSQFCPKCGQPVGENEKFCGVCGSPIEIEDTGNHSVKKWVLCGGILIAAVAIVLGIVSTVKRSTGYNGTIKKMAKAYKNADIDMMVELTSTVELDIQGEENLYKYWDNEITDKLDAYEDRVGEIKSFKIEIVDADDISERKLEDAMEYVEDVYNVDTSDVKKAIRVDLRDEIKGKKKKMTDKEKDVYLLKEKGGWKIYLGKGFD